MVKKMVSTHRKKLVSLKQMANELGVTKSTMCNLRSKFYFPEPVETVKHTNYYDYRALKKAIENPISIRTGLPVNQVKRNAALQLNELRRDSEEHGNYKVRDLQANIHYGHYEANRRWDSHRSVESDSEYSVGLGG